MEQTTNNLNGYLCFYKNKKYEVYAESTYSAQLKCAKDNNIKKNSDIRVHLCEKAGTPVIHIADF